MSTSLSTARIELSKQLGDYWAGTATSAGAAGGTTIVDTALKAKANDWISDAPQEMYDFITSGTYDGEERKISSLDNTTGTLTTLAHTGQIASAVTYEVHRLFSPSEKRRALITAARNAFPCVFTPVRDESLTTGNWLMNGDVETWTVATYPDNWRVSSVTATKTTTAKLFKRGVTSCKLNTAAGYLYQDWTYNDDLKELRGKTVTFRAKGYCDTASCLRLCIHDGTTSTYSSYHDGDSKWVEDNTPMEVTATIAEDATDVSFRVYHAVAAGTSYVDDLRVYGPARDKLYVGGLGLHRNTPHKVGIVADNFIQYDPWHTLHNWNVSNGYLYFPAPANYRVRIEGIGAANWTVSGAVSTLWTAIIDLDQPQLDIVIAEAVMELYRQMISPNYTSGERDNFAQMLQYWEKEMQVRKGKYSMIPPPASVIW